MKFHLQVLTDKQKEVLKKLNFLKDFPFYLAGGTATALQLGHRTSLDFDFYSKTKLDEKKLSTAFKKIFPNISVSKNQPTDTFQVNINQVNLSIFYYPYKLVEKLIDFPPIKLASLEDIAAMKVAAIVQRAKQRDFFDLYYLILKLGLPKIIEATYKKYPWYKENDQIIFKALTYFKEADQDKELKLITIFDKNATWSKIKAEISKEVEKYLKKVKTPRA